MNAPPCALALLALGLATAVHASEVRDEIASEPTPKREWSFAVTAYPTDVRGGENYTSAIAAADHGPLHLEARYNYESVGARSAYVGWAFSGGETLTWQATPIVGGAWGTTQSVVAGVEASLAWKALDVYIEGEYVPTHSHTDAYTYAWSELGFRAADWLRVGIVGQRTRAYSGDRQFQRGPMVQVTWGIVTIGAYWFNPGSNEQVFVASLGAKF